jgi:hypothetical protein
MAVDPKTYIRTLWRGRSGAILVILLWLAVAPQGGCTAIVQYKDYDEIPACGEGDDQTVRDLQFSMDGMDIHDGQLVEIRLVNSNDFVVARAIVDPLVGSAFSMRLRGAVLEGPHRVDFWADLSKNGAYDAPPTDHGWRLETCASGAWTFSHSTNFADVSQPEPGLVGGDFVLNLVGMVPHLGQLLEFWVIDQSNGRMVGYYRLAEPPDVDFTIRIRGIIEPSAQYTVAFYADKNNNLQYDIPDLDHAWRLSGTGDASGLTIDFAHHTDFDDISEDIAL